jgi:transposase
MTTSSPASSPHENFTRFPCGIRGQPPDLRKAVRQLRSRPLVEKLHLWLQDHLPRVPGWSDLAKAMRYSLRHWDGLILYLDDGRLEMGRVDDWRGGSRFRGVAVFRRLSPNAGASIRTVAPFPVAARQTGRADFPHPAFSRPVRPSLSAGRRVAVERCRGRVFRRDARPGSGGTRRLVAPCGASTNGGPVVQCIYG